LVFHQQSRSYPQQVSASAPTLKQQIHILFLEFSPHILSLKTVNKSNSIIQEGLELLVDSFPLLCRCCEDFPAAVFHHNLPQHEGFKHRNERAALSTFQVMRDVLYIFKICSPTTNISAAISMMWTLRHLASTMPWVSGSQLRGIEDGKGGTTIGIVGAMVLDKLRH
jgi:hypothetical protein